MESYRYRVKRTDFSGLLVVKICGKSPQIFATIL
jgi:hypothetical protein